MNKKDVSLFLTGVTGRRLCTQRLAFREWVEKRLDRSIFAYEFGLGDICIANVTRKEIADSITDAEWQEIAEFFMNVEESEVEEK